MHTQIFQRGLLGKYPAVLSLFCIERQREREREREIKGKIEQYN
jgi:hypothetical protein